MTSLKILSAAAVMALILPLAAPTASFAQMGSKASGGAAAAETAAADGRAAAAESTAAAHGSAAATSAAAHTATAATATNGAAAAAATRFTAHLGDTRGGCCQGQHQGHHSGRTQNFKTGHYRLHMRDCV